MRTIHKQSPPHALTQWRLPRLAAERTEGMECSYAELRREPKVLAAVEDGLFREQGGLCAYTGHRIGLQVADEGQREVDFHIEHLTPQTFCRYGQDAEYANVVACWPRPNCGFEPAYGARKKGSWPAPNEHEFFVSPLRADCSARFSFSQRGEISPTRPDDRAAHATIQRLGLNHPTLVDLRRAAIRGTLFPANRTIGLANARRLLRRMRQDIEDVDRGVAVQLIPFCFAVQPVVEYTIIRLESKQAEND